MAVETIVQRLDVLANDPLARPFASVPSREGYSTDISYRQLANVVDAAAFWLDENLRGHDSQSEFPTFVYTGTVDLCRAVLLLAGAKTGRKILLVRRYAAERVFSDDPALLAIVSRITIVLPDQASPGTEPEAFDMIQSSCADGLMVQPSMLSKMVRSPHMLSGLRKLRCVITGSALMRKPEIDLIQQNGVPPVYNLYGSTETIRQLQSVVDRDDWPYVSFPPESGVTFQHELDDLYELVVKRKRGAHDFPSVFCSFPDMDAFSS